MDTGRMFRSPEVCDMLDVSFRRIDYWARTGLVRPSQEADGSGSRRLYSFHDLVRLGVVKKLLDLGVELPAIRETMQKLENVDVNGSVLCVDPSGVAVARDDATVMKMVHGGDGVVCVDVKGLVEELREKAS